MTQRCGLGSSSVGSSWHTCSPPRFRHQDSPVSWTSRCSLGVTGCTFLAIDSDDPEDLSLADLHGSVDGSPHGGGVLVDRHHAYFAIILQQGHVTSIFLTLF